MVRDRRQESILTNKGGSHTCKTSELCEGLLPPRSEGSSELDQPQCRADREA